MEIELVTTKKKLTASIVKQMPFASAKEKEEILNAFPINIYGYVTVGDEDYVLVKGKKDFLRITIRDWRITNPESKSIYSDRNAAMTFNSIEDRDRWLEIHYRILEIGKQTHIYL